VQFIEIDSAQADRRIDNFLLQKLKGVPKSRIYNLLRRGEIRVNKKRVKPIYRLQLGDVIRIAPLRTSQTAQLARPNKAILKKLSACILYEDEDLLILNKPSGMAVHGGSGINAGLIELLRMMRPDADFLELVHRLDRDTSGCLLIAKKRSILRELHAMLRAGQIVKIYYALTLGKWPKKINRVDVPLQKNIKVSGERIVKVADEGKSSVTDFIVARKFALATFVKIKLLTGRTHQIRVHAQFAGHPLAGDPKYGDRAFNRMLRAKGLHRLFLHAGELQFMLPSSGKRISVNAPLDEELQQFLTSLI
jgi:23S rRNA pseudouridine955/2504/2580 synthase